MTHSERGHGGGMPGGPENGNPGGPELTAPVEPEHRLHPMTLVLRAAVSIPALVFLLLPVFRSPDSSALFNLVLSFLYALVVLPWLVLHYVRFRYRLTPDEVVIHSGVLTRRRRNIPVDRIQNIEIEQQLLQRLTGTARVRIYTAGSQEAEGALDVVSLAEAHRIRQTVRGYQREAAVTPESSPPAAQEPRKPGASPEVLLAMDARRVLLSGAFRFSLLYIAIIFTFLQYVEPDPEALVSWLTRGRLAGLARAAMASPWAAAAIGIVVAVLVGWVSGIAVNFNRFYRFVLTLEKDRLHRKHGLLSVREGTIPLRRVQALILRTNPLMRRFGWYALDVQTMGADVREQGHSVAIPFGRLGEIQGVIARIREGMPDARTEPWAFPQSLQSVSRLTIRRALVRYTLGLAAATGLAVVLTDSSAWLLLALWPLALGAAVLRWRCMGYDLHDRHLVVRRGVMQQYTWIIPVGRLQVLQTRSSLFQRHLDLRTVYADTAGASPVRGADIIDLERGTADQLADEIYGQFSVLTPR
jgi:putative membrane protein